MAVRVFKSDDSDKGKHVQQPTTRLRHTLGSQGWGGNACENYPADELQLARKEATLLNCRRLG